MTTCIILEFMIRDVNEPSDAREPSEGSSSGRCSPPEMRRSVDENADGMVSQWEDQVLEAME